MGQSTDQIEQWIAAERSDLGKNLRELEAKAKEMKDWRTHYRRNPHVFLGVAAGVGALLGAIVWRGRRATSESYIMRDMNQHDSHSGHVRGLRSRATSQAADTWDRIADAAVGLASAKVLDLVAEAVPGIKPFLGGPQRT